ncbi:MAG: prolipoprotein diacylglyceryl transferase [Candidatus Nitronauta litoralis]|uniref:Prolipoprotein diacylglyceryl transferase n=1 Tax=Candidatus Nitronauta litoralis TaxID=2705533 RepID=A0A7T0BVJ9_9BACT|nr:MAG: prolipoprotein diacylglyceryl transferase [Candidatus Nitronauta litoralis]
MSFIDLVFLFILSIALISYLIWGFKYLPGESRQILAVLPIKKRSGDSWDGLNITWYGLLVANGVTGAAALSIFLFGGLGWNTLKGLLLIAWILAWALPSAKIIARWVEEKPNTFTTSGAFAAGLVVAWPGVILINQISGDALGTAFDPMNALTLLMIAYVFGEGLGRLGCISFGCCYGKRVEDCPPWLRRVVDHFHFVFQGKTKKIAYAQGWEGIPVVPVQGITAIVLVFTGLISLTIFLSGHPSAAFLVALSFSQAWRVFSEYFRSDYRGNGTFTFYQVISLISIFLGIGLTFFIKDIENQSFDLLRGTESFRQSTTLLFLNGLWIIVLYYMGRSRVTGSSIRFHVNQNGT